MDDTPRRARDIKSERIQFKYRDRIPVGAITVLASWPDQGKGLWVTDVAAALSHEGNNVLYCEMERPHGSVVKPRLEVAGADMDRIFLHRIVLPDQIEQIRGWLIEYAIDLLIIDPVAAALHGVSRHTDSIRKVTGPLQAMLEETHCACIIIEHVVKKVSPHANPLAMIGGDGSGLTAAAGMAYVIGTNPHNEDVRIVCCVKNNLRDKPQALFYEVDAREYEDIGSTPFLVFQEEGYFDPMHLYASRSKPGRPALRREEAIVWLAEYLWKHGKTTASTVYATAKAARISRKTLKNAAKEAEVVIDPPEGGNRCTWELSDPLKERIAELGVREALLLEEITDAEIQAWLEGKDK